mgnify:CR=1 FL=1
MKLLGKGIFNVGRFAVAEVLPSAMEQVAKQVEKNPGASDEQREKASELKKKAEELENKKKTAESEKTSLANQLGNLVNEMEKTKKKISDKESEISNKEDELILAKAKETKTPEELMAFAKEKNMEIQR